MARDGERWVRPEAHAAWGQLGRALCAMCRGLRSGVVWKICFGKIAGREVGGMEEKAGQLPGWCG